MTETDKRKIVEIAQKRGLALVVLFGSLATGETHTKSDVDIGFLSRRDIEYREAYAISLEFARIFRNPDVELVNLDNVSPELKREVAEHGIVLFEKRRSIFDAFSMYAHRLYMETKPLRVYREQYVKDFLKSYAK